MKIALVGYGKMGHIIEQVALSRGHQIVCTIDIDNPEDFESQEFMEADAVIEFSSPASAPDNVRKCLKAGKKTVCGTTGWFADNAEEMKMLCAEGGTLLWSSNFSVGVYLFSAVSRFLAHLMQDFPGYSVSIDETHHIHKKDAPSGTALTLAEGILGEMPRLSKADLPIASHREGEVPGIHTVRFESEADSIVLTHDAKSRAGFALGAVLAAEFVATHSGLLTMDDLFRKEENKI